MSTCDIDILLYVVGALVMVFICIAIICSNGQSPTYGHVILSLFVILTPGLNTLAAGVCVAVMSLACIMEYGGRLWNKPIKTTCDSIKW